MKGHTMNILKATLEEVIEYVDNLSDEDLTKLLEESTVEEHDKLVKALLECLNVKAT